MSKLSKYIVAAALTVGVPVASQGSIVSNTTGKGGVPTEITHTPTRPSSDSYEQRQKDLIHTLQEKGLKESVRFYGLKFKVIVKLDEGHYVHGDYMCFNMKTCEIVPEDKETSDELERTYGSQGDELLQRVGELIMEKHNNQDEGKGLNIANSGDNSAKLWSVTRDACHEILHEYELQEERKKHDQEEEQLHAEINEIKNDRDKMTGLFTLATLLVGLLIYKSYKGKKAIDEIFSNEDYLNFIKNVKLDENSDVITIKLLKSLIEDADKLAKLLNDKYDIMTKRGDMLGEDENIGNKKGINREALKDSLIGMIGEYKKIIRTKKNEPLSGSSRQILNQIEGFINEIEQLMESIRHKFQKGDISLNKLGEFYNIFVMPKINPESVNLNEDNE